MQSWFDLVSKFIVHHILLVCFLSEKKKKVLRAILLVDLMVEVMHQCVLSCPGLLDSFKLKIEKYNCFKLPAPLRGRYTPATGHQLICFLLRRIGWCVLLKEGGSGKGGGGHGSPGL